MVPSITISLLSFVHMTVVGGEPVEVQVKVKGEALPLNSKLVTCGLSVGVQMCNSSLHQAQTSLASAHPKLMN